MKSGLSVEYDRSSSFIKLHEEYGKDIASKFGLYTGSDEIDQSYPILVESNDVSIPFIPAHIRASRRTKRIFDIGKKDTKPIDYVTILEELIDEYII